MESAFLLCFQKKRNLYSRIIFLQAFWSKAANISRALFGTCVQFSAYFPFSFGDVATNIHYYQFSQVPANMKPIPLPSKSSRKSYGPSALRQLLKLEKDFAQIRERRDISYATIRQATEASASRSRVLRGKEQLIQRLRSFREVLHGFNQDNISLRQSIEDIALQNQSMMHTLELNKLDLVNQKNELESSRSDGRRNLEEQRRMDRELRERRCELVGDLNLIYPINRSKSGRVFVANIWLPPMDQFSSCDDTTLSASLGYTVHLLILLSRITGVPLRYPLKFNCSASSVINMAAARVSDRDRE